jgi:signal peptidase II
MVKKQFILNFIIIFFIFFLDRITKNYILNLAEDQGIIDITINPFLNIILVWNSGIGFGLLQFDENIIYNLITVLIVIVNIIIIYLIFNSEKLHKILFSMILGGSLGNLYDRIYYNSVPDFIDLNYNGYHWFVFNVADIFISLGIIALIFLELFIKTKNEK